MKKTLTIILTTVTCFVCFSQQNGISIPSNVLNKTKDTLIIFNEEVKEDELVYCEIDSIWEERKIIITTEVIQLFKSHSTITPKRKVFVKISRIYFVDGSGRNIIKTFKRESFNEKYIDEVLDDARLYVINELRKIKP